MSILKAVLGPTNTGKTHYAIERMLGHASGMIGLPLRLLAREVYDRICAEKGAAHCALVTGEERIEPDTARYFVCTVESMPVQRAVDFLAIDEIQLAEDEDRGHVFTDRILRARGRSETLLLGSDTMRGLLRQLDLNADTDPRERFSELRYAGPTKITKLPKRTAIVAFSSEQVYAIGELLKRQKGGAAIVMGALSPRTRNAQVALYQSGDVDYLVATDAIGMGLNLDVDRIAFAARSKFDGRRHRLLTAAECGQIAGRAGRFRSDGEFGETSDCPEFDEAMRRRIETHEFEPVDAIQWRSADLDFASIRALIASLSAPSPNPVLRQNPDALDEWVLRRISEHEGIGPDVTGERRVRRLWDLARLPDFRKAGRDGHARLVLGLADTLADPDARLSDAGMEKRLEQLSLARGDISSLEQRLAAIRTWTYAAHREDWLAHPEHWRERTREIEDALSDALHEALTARFVDRRTTALLAGLSKEDALVTEMSDKGEVSVEGHVVGRLVGLHFEPASSARTLEGKAVRNAAMQALRPILARRLSEITEASAADFALGPDRRIAFRGEAIARLVRGGDWLSPRIELIGGETGESGAREAVQRRLDSWLKTEMARRLPTHYGLKALGAAEGLEGLARGLAFRLMETGAAVDLRADDPGLRLDKAQREALKAIGVRAGRVSAHATDAQKPAAQRLLAELRGLFDGAACALAPEGAGSFEPDSGWSDGALLANGYLRFGPRAIRADLAERLAWEIAKRRKDAGRNAFALPPELASIVSCPGDAFPAVLKGFGLSPAEHDPDTKAVTLWRYQARARQDDDAPARRHPRRPADKGPAGEVASRRQRSGKPPRPDGRKPAPRAPSAPDPDSPFAALAVLIQPPPAADKPKRRKRRRGKGQGAAASPDATGRFVYTPFQ